MRCEDLGLTSKFGWKIVIFLDYRRSHVPEAGHGAPDFVHGFRKGNPWIRIGRAFSPWAVALSAPRALPWAGIGARRWRLRPAPIMRIIDFIWACMRACRWRLRPSAGCGFLGSVTTSAFLKLTHYRFFPIRLR